MRHRRLLWAILTFVLLLSPGCSGKGERDDTEESGADKPAFSMTAREFSEERLKDDKGAQAKYRGKLIELVGAIMGVDRTPTRKGLLILQGAPGDLVGVQCSTKDIQPWLKALPGQTVRLKGRGAQRDSGPMLEQCTILEVSGPVPPSLTAEELAKEYAAGPVAAQRKYEGKHLLVSGKVEEVTVKETKLAWVAFKTAGGPQVFCVFTPFFEDQWSTLKPGQKVKVLGQYALNRDEDEVRLWFCILVGRGK